MRKPNKHSKRKKLGESFLADSDELQLLDENDLEWVAMWKAAAKQLTKLHLQVLEPFDLEGTLIKTKKHK